MDAARDKLLRRFTIAATSLTAVVLLTADYGPQPHVFSSVSTWWDAGRKWLFSPTEKERAEIEKMREIYGAQKSRDSEDGHK